MGQHVKGVFGLFVSADSYRVGHDVYCKTTCLTIAIVSVPLPPGDEVAPGAVECTPTSPDERLMSGARNMAARRDETGKRGRVFLIRASMAA
jgi:hypothetical protein